VREGGLVAEALGVAGGGVTSKALTSASVIARRENTGIGEKVPTAPLPQVAGLHLAQLGGEPFGTVLADPPWRFQNRTGKVAPEHRRLARYDTMAAGYGDWIRLFRQNGLAVEDLIELQAPEGAVTTYDDDVAEWARRWPAAAIRVTSRS